MKIVCITGGIGSGKSLVAKIFQTLGYPVYNSDERAKQMYFLPEVKQEIIKILGKNAYIDENKIDKQFIASKIFSDKALLEKVNQIIHSAVKKDFDNFVIKHKNSQIIFKESALVFEAGLKNFCDKIILVTAPVDLRIQRVMQRDNISKEEILNRMSHQWEDEKKIQQSDFVVINDNVSPLLPQVAEIIKHLDI